MQHSDITATWPFYELLLSIDQQNLITKRRKAQILFYKFRQEAIPAYNTFKWEKEVSFSDSLATSWYDWEEDDEPSSSSGPHNVSMNEICCEYEESSPSSSSSLCSPKTEKLEKLRGILKRKHNSRSEIFMDKRSENIELDSVIFIEMEDALKEFLENDTEFKKLHQLECSQCHSFFGGDQLYNTDQENTERDAYEIAKCGDCLDADIEKLSSLFTIWKPKFLSRWICYLENRLIDLFGTWPTIIDPLISGLYADYFQKKELELYLDNEINLFDFKDMNEMIAETYQIFAMEYYDFQCCCRELERIKTPVEFEDYFQLFKIYFPQRFKSERRG